LKEKQTKDFSKEEVRNPAIASATSPYSGMLIGVDELPMKRVGICKVHREPVVSVNQWSGLLEYLKIFSPKCINLFMRILF
jgi:hypothetical protein